MIKDYSCYCNIEIMGISGTKNLIKNLGNISSDYDVDNRWERHLLIQIVQLTCSRIAINNKKLETNIEKMQ